MLKSDVVAVADASAEVDADAVDGADAEAVHRRSTPRCRRRDADAETPTLRC